MINKEEITEELEAEEPENKEMSDSEVVAFCENEVSRGIGGNAYGNENEDVSLAMDYYFGRKPGLSKAAARDINSSTYVSMDVMDAVEATVAEIMPTFATDEIAFYNADDERDEKQSKTESDQANYIFFNECDGHNILQTGLRDAALSRNATAKVYWDSRKEVEYESWENVDPMNLMQLMQPQTEGEEVELIEGDFSSIGIESDEMQAETVTSSVKIKRTRQVERPVVESVQPENAIISGDHKKPTLYDVRFAAHENIVTQSSLIEQGVPEDVVDQLEDFSPNTESYSRSRTAAEYDYFSADRSVRQIRVLECYCLLDVDGDGIAERRKILYSGGNLLSNDPWNSVALVGGVLTTVPHKYKGLSLFERLKQIQDAKTPVMRAIIDGTRLSSNPRIGVVTGQVNIDDLLTSRTGGNVRADSADSIFALPSAEVPQSSYAFLELMDNARRERGGSAVSTASTAQQLDNQSEQTFARTMSAMELINALGATTFAETFIRSIFVQLHEVIRENHKGELSTKVGGQWIKSVPSEWKKRTGVTISIGASNAERAKQSGALAKALEVQSVLQEKGSVMYNEQGVYKALIQSLSLAGIEAPESYFTDPSSKEGKQASQKQKQQQAEAKQKETMMQMEMAKAQQGLAQAEIMKGQAALQSQQVKFENDKLTYELDKLKAIVGANEASIEQEQNAKEHEDEVALKLTDMELKYNQEISPTNEEVL